MVIEPSFLVSEIDRLAAEGIDSEGRVFVSPRASLILPTHQALDGVREQCSRNRQDRHHRPRHRPRVRGPGAAARPPRLSARGPEAARRRGARADGRAQPRAGQPVRRRTGRRRRRARVTRSRRRADRAAAQGGGPGDPAPRRAPASRILFEGAQGVLLDHWWGTYPFVTSSDCLPATAAASCGISAQLLGPVVGVMKAYATRVGSGPLPHRARGRRRRRPARARRRVRHHHRPAPPLRLVRRRRRPLRGARGRDRRHRADQARRRRWSRYSSLTGTGRTTRSPRYRP